ncbi:MULTISPECIES: hypothetical protein [Cyanophyceae]|uniref:CHAT domain-containing protein n=1 Tax=Leptolyngbya subtilissima DQ-A4 TaxID=2933933 RepID=A0ABV0K8W4_9CYAN|nr:hypothetical protein [Nodosilinea sp. FACHB-141]MBD2110349.1 hypothetical protein [Nodosilinea sp. FACHB-141]
MTTQDRGAKIQAPSARPSVDLAKLLELLADSIVTEQDPSQDSDPKKRSLFLFSADPATNKTRLRVCTSAVLLRLFSHTKFKDAFKPSDTGGFVQDFNAPPFGLRAKLGGELPEGNPAKLPGHLDKMIAAIDQALDAALPDESDLPKLLLDRPAQQLQTLASSVGATFKDQVYQANLQPLAFDSSDRNRSAAVAKVLVAVEQVEADNCFGRMKEAIASRLEQRGFDEDDIGDAIDSLEAERDRADSQITRFLNFLDDAALSRVRLNVAFRIMETVAEQARSSTQRDNQYLVEYIDRALALVETVKADGLSVDLTAHYGQNAEFDLATYLNQATFYTCLAVWPEWKTQIFEEKVSSKDSYGVQRGVSYRFRINGNNPEKGKPAFDARLDFISETLLAEDPLSVSPYSLCRRLAELIVLDAVIPKLSGEAQEISTTTITQTLQTRLATLMADGRPGIQTLIQDLRDRTGAMQAVSRAMIKLLQDKGNKIVAQAQRRTAQQFICVKRGVVAWSRLEGAEPGVKDLLVSAPTQNQESVEWFNHIEISDTPDVTQLLFSLKVTTELTEHNLVPNKGADPHIMQAQRLFPGQLLQVIWVPCESGKDQPYNLTPTAKQAKAWALSSSVLVEYELRTLTRQSRAQKGGADTQQWHAAAIAAFPLLIYCCLWRIIQRLREGAAESPTDFTTLMLRLQQTGKNSDSEGEAYVYGAAQSIEALLAQDGPVRMQGITLDNLASDSARYVKSGAFDALVSAFPLALTTPSQPHVETIGLISYSTRPCDEAPTSNGDNRSHLFFTQSYIASAIAQPFSGYELKPERTQSDIVRSHEEMQNQRLVREEIGHLRQLGCKHIILLSHAYGGRHLNRIADHNSPLTPVTFLEEVFQSFPDLILYPLLRDVFPATRLRKRDRKEAAFEILKAEDHVNFLPNTAMDVVRDIIPVYTFATLHAVDEEKRPQSGFCVYFLVSDHRVRDIRAERGRQHLLDPEGDSQIHPCLIAVLRGLHFIEAERGVKGGQLIPVLDPFRWISPATREATGEVEILHSRRRGLVHLSYPALLTHVSQTLHRRQP